MNENRSIDDVRQNLESMLYGYYIKYTKMKELVEQAFYNTPQSNCIDIYVDVFDMLKPIYSKDIYTNKQYIIVSSVINLAAHLRQYFKKYHNMWARIFLVYADDSTTNHKQFCPEFGDNSYKTTLNYARNNELILSQLELIKILAAYIEDVYFVRKYTMFPIFVYDNIQKSYTTPAIILTKNNYAYQIPALLSNAAVFRPRKYAAEDTSFAICKFNALSNYYSNINRTKTLEYLSAINPEHLSLLMSLTGNNQFNLRSVVSSTVAIRILYEAIKSGKILNAHSSDVNYLYQSMPNISKYINDYNFACRYKACDIVYQGMMYSQMPESLDYTWMVNFKDPSTVQDINNRYFVDNPLDLNSL